MFLHRTALASFILAAAGCVGLIAGEEPANSVNEAPRPTEGAPRTMEGAPRTMEGAPRTMEGAPRTMEGGPSPAPAVAAPAPRPGSCDDLAQPRLVRLSPTRYRNTIAVLFSGRPSATRREVPEPPANLAIPLEPPASIARFSTIAAAEASMSDFELRRSFASTYEVATTLVAQLRRDTKGCWGGNPAKVAPENCVSTLVESKGGVLFRRPPTASEQTEYAALFRAASAAQPADEALALVFQSMLLSPRFLFLTELGDGRPGGGRVRLSSYELAAQLAYALTDHPPDEELWAAARAGGLETPAEVRAKVLRIVGRLFGAFADPPVFLDTVPDGLRTRVGSEPVHRFVRELFGYEGVAAIFKSTEWHDGPGLRRDTDIVTSQLLRDRGRQGLLEALLTSDVGSLSEQTYRSYGATAPKINEGRQTVRFPSAERAGMLTQPAFLVTHSDATMNHPVPRGRFVSETLLCRPVPNLPIGQIPILPPPTATTTMRDRLAVHTRDPACAACHRLMDPLGLAFEMYDDLGRLRLSDGGRPGDASGVLTGAGSQDGAFANAPDLARRLAASEVVRACFVKHSLRYWLGREDRPSDACVLREAEEAYVSSGGDYASVLVALLSSPSFLQRHAPSN